MEFLKAFLVGGIICLTGQLLIDNTRLTPARILVGFVVAGVILGALGIYKPIIEFAGTGATVPLTGFGSVLAEGTKKAVEEQGLIGAITGPLTASAAGITTALVAGIVVAVIAKPKSR